MHRHLPPLNALRAFDAAARHGSFRSAAAELFVTPSAVSHQVKALETHLGASLFERRTREVRLTKVGQRYFDAVDDVFARLDAATREVERSREPSSLVISVSPTFATEWLVPRLTGFQSLHPDVDVLMLTRRDIPNFATTDVAVSIPYGRGPWPGLHSELLLAEDLVPVCSPQLRITSGKRARRPSTPRDFARSTLIHVTTRPGQWLECLDALGLISSAKDLRGPTFQSTHLAVDAAVAGLGIALVARALVAPHLADGRLTIPVELSLQSGAGYYLVHPVGADRDLRVNAFIEWLKGTLFADSSLPS